MKLSLITCNNLSYIINNIKKKQKIILNYKKYYQKAE